MTYGSNYSSIAELTHPLIRRYAKNHGADFLVIDGSKRKFGPLHPSYEDFQTIDFLEDYQEIVHLDTDVVVSKEAEWLLTLSAGKFAAFDEIRRNERVSDWNVWPHHSYYNLGVWGCTQSHAELWSYFQPSDKVDGHQDYLNARLKILGIPVFDVGPEYNKMCYDWHGDYVTYDYRKSANIIHYAGVRNQEEIIARINGDIAGLMALGRI